MEKAVKSTNVVEKKCFYGDSQTGMDKVNEEFEYLQKRLMKHLNIRFFWLVCQASKDAENPRILIQSDLQSWGGGIQLVENNEKFVFF